MQHAEMGPPVPPREPLYGREAHRTRAGVHADGLKKCCEHGRQTNRAWEE